LKFKRPTTAATTKRKELRVAPLVEVGYQMFGVCEEKRKKTREMKSCVVVWWLSLLIAVVGQTPKQYI
jgi:hypothetical protein